MLCCGVLWCVMLCCVVLCCVVLCCVLWCVVLCCVVSCGVCAVWCGVCDTLNPPSPPPVFNMSAWCQHTRRRFERTHGDVLRGHTGEVGREGVVVSFVFFIGKISQFGTFLGHLNRMLGSSLIANFLLTLIGPRGVITCFRGSPKETLGSYLF